MANTVTKTRISNNIKTMLVENAAVTVPASSV